MDISKFELENNLRVLSINDKESKSVSIVALVKVGSRYEDEKISGLAHFVEHNFFKGTKKLPSSKDIGMAIEKLGGSSNAFTSYEYTGYYIKVPKEKFEEAAEIMSDMIRNSIFPEVEVEREKGVVIEEIRMYEDIPMRKVGDLFMINLFGKDHPLGRDIAGSVQSVRNLGREDIINFTKKYYSGRNMIVSVGGGVQARHVEKVISEKFKQIPKGTESSYKNFHPRNLKNKFHTYQKKVEQTHMVIGGFGLPRSHKDRFALGVGLTILGKGFGSILFQVIRERLGLAYYVRANHSSFHETGVWDISLGVDNKRVEEVTQELMKELKSFKQGKFDAEDLVRAKNYIIGKLVTDLGGIL